MLKCYKQWTANDVEEENVQFLRRSRPEVVKELDQKLWTIDNTTSIRTKDLDNTKLYTAASY